MKKNMNILGIESSCDETSVSIVRNGTEELATVIASQIDVHKDFGGVVPEIASRHHVKNITIVLEECLKKANMTMKDIDGIAIQIKLNIKVNYLIYVKRYEEAYELCKKLLGKKEVIELYKCEERGIKDWSSIKSALKDGLRDYVFAKTKRNPMILPIIMEV